MKNTTYELQEGIIKDLNLPKVDELQLRAIFNSVWLDGYWKGNKEGLSFAQSLVSIESINVGDEDHDLEVKLEDAERIVGYNEPF